MAQSDNRYKRYHLWIAYESSDQVLFSN